MGSELVLTQNIDFLSDILNRQSLTTLTNTLFHLIMRVSYKTKAIKLNDHLLYYICRHVVSVTSTKFNCHNMQSNRVKKHCNVWFCQSCPHLQLLQFTANVDVKVRIHGQEVFGQHTEPAKRTESRSLKSTTTHQFQNMMHRTVLVPPWKQGSSHTATCWQEKVQIL